MSRGMNSALHEGAATLRGPGADELRQAVGDAVTAPTTTSPPTSTSWPLWGAQCLASLAVAVRVGEGHPMRDYLVAMAIADAQG
jgi:hypothetical protein